ncbi:hypothetical protein CRENBAI_022221 [Crenichthys baileyi]|uniref:Integrase zinc-binding domain-containing protein n=1 Tax=Crenichthys baileyi TaxID=28760 RepID=A0AAV9R387_9TELE
MKVDYKVVWASSGLDTTPHHRTKPLPNGAEKKPHSFISHLPVWKEDGMKNARNKEVKHSELFLACDHLTTEQAMVVYLKKGKGHSRILGPDKDGNNETHAVCSVTRRQTRERCEDPQSSGETLHLGRKPNDTDLATMQDQDPDLHTIRELVGLSAEASPLATSETKELQTLRRNPSHLKLEKGLLVYTQNGRGTPRWVFPTDHRGVMVADTHDSPVGGDRGIKATLHTLQQVAYWPSMAHDTQVYI